MRSRFAATFVALALLSAPLCAAVTFAIPEYPVPADNAWDYYLAAFDLLPKGNRVEAAEGEPSVEDVEQLMREARPALDKLREGLGKPCVRPGPETFDPSDPMDVVPNARAREMTRLLRWEGWLHAQHGDYQAAFRSDLDAITLGQDVARHGRLIDKLVSIACEAIACSAIRRTAAKASDDEPALTSVVEGLQGVEAREVPYWETLAEEYVHAIEWLKWLGTPGAITREEFEEEFGTRAIAAALGLARREVDPYYSDAVVVAKRDTWEWDFSAVACPPEDTPAGFVASPLVAEHLVRRHLANLRGTLLVAALQLHHARHGRYPEQLATLVPEPLEQIPLDPWTGEPFVYASDGDSYSLYSVGPDRGDDGGLEREAGDPDRYDLLFSTAK